MKYLVDTNVLLRFCADGDPEHSLCVAAIRALVTRGQDVCLCAQVLIEHWAVATRPVSANGLGLPPADVDVQLALASAAMPCQAEPPDIAERWREVAKENGVCGKQAHDARIAAFMLAHGIGRLLTLNPRDFDRYQGITPVTPQEIVNWT